MTTFYPTDGSNMSPIGTWWEEKGNQSGISMCALIETLRREQTYIERRIRKAIQLSENIDLIDLDAWNFATDTERDGPYQYNIIESIQDTIHAEIISNRTKVQYMTYGGDWDAAERAENLTKFIAGVFHECDIYEEVAPEVVMDAETFGDGIGKVTTCSGKARVHRVFPYCLVWDDVEASNGPMQQIYEVQLVSRHQLMRDYYDNKKAIKIIQDAPEHVFKVPNGRYVRDIIKVYEGWKFGTDELPGRHLCALSNGVLDDEEWCYPHGPFVALKYKRRRKGWMGKGIPEILEGQQRTINELRDKIITQILTASPFEWIDDSNSINEAESSNQIWRRIKSASPPQHIAYNSVPVDLFNQLQQEVSDAASMVGVNMIMLKSEIPPGLDGGSGKAVRIYNDIKSKRFMRFARALEQWYVEVADMMIKFVERDYKNGEKYQVNIPGDGDMESISYKDVRLPQDSFVIRAMPANFLQDTQSGQLSDIEELANIFPEEMKPYLLQQLRSPDIEKITKRLGGGINAIERILTKLMKTDAKPGQFPPIPQMDLGLCLKVSSEFIVEAVSQGAPDYKVNKLVDWQKLVKKQLDAIALTQAPPPAPAMPSQQLQQPMQLPTDAAALQLPATMPVQ